MKAKAGAENGPNHRNTLDKFPSNEQRLEEFHKYCTEGN